MFNPDMIKNFTKENGIYSINDSCPRLKFNKITMVNVNGALRRLMGGDGLYRPQKPSEMININIPQNHFNIHKNSEISNLLEEFLYNKVIVYKISLISLGFPSKKISDSVYVYFRIKVDDIDQRYPVSQEIRIS